MARPPSKLERMGRKNYNADWDAAFAAAMSATVPPGLGGMRFDQALTRLFPQYSRNRLQAWLKSGHITLDGKSAEASHPVAGGERVVLEPPPVPELASPQAQRMPLKVVHEDAQLIVIDKPAGLVVHPGAGPRMAVTHRGKPARTAFRVLERFGRAALVECRLETGRTHQIRVHFQHIRHPLVGDVVYRRGTRHGFAFPRQALHAAELSLRHPRDGKVMTWHSPLPRDLKGLLERLRNEG